MENKDPDRIPPKPGIAEAIHPEIGNGVMWETDQHRFLLRSPDPTKDLDTHLLDIDIDLVNTSDQEKTEETVDGDEHGSPTITAPVGLTNIEEGIPQVQIGSSLQEENFIPTIPKKLKTKAEAKAKKKAEANEKENDKIVVWTQPDETVNASPKAPKASKRVRKAAKSVRKQEEDEKQAIAQNLALTESTLSPYTQWLKNLKGSEYVHPYDDDFAFVQGTGPAKEGISETFAELLASQGYKDQAVEMYLKLMEKYPEKSGFFAAKIEALQ